MYSIPLIILLLGLLVHGHGTAVTPKDALARLMQGNMRYVSDALEHPNRTPERREAISAKQSPFATIVGCSDSRVAPEIIFDQGVGDLFVVRDAGNIVGPIELASVEFSAVYLGSAVILVLGHENCGAVDAVVQGNTADIEAIADWIRPAVAEAKARSSDNLLERSIKTNARRMRDLLLHAPPIRELVEAGKLEIHAAYYHLKTGVVELLESPIIAPRAS